MTVLRKNRSGEYLIKLEPSYLLFFFFFLFFLLSFSPFFYDNQTKTLSPPFNLGKKPHTLTVEGWKIQHRGSAEKRKKGGKGEMGGFETVVVVLNYSTLLPALLRLGTAAAVHRQAGADTHNSLLCKNFQLPNSNCNLSARSTLLLGFIMRFFQCSPLVAKTRLLSSDNVWRSVCRECGRKGDEARDVKGCGDIRSFLMSPMLSKIPGQYKPPRTHRKSSCEAVCHPCRCTFDCSSISSVYSLRDPTSHYSPIVPRLWRVADHSSHSREPGSNSFTCSTTVRFSVAVQRKEPTRPLFHHTIPTIYRQER